MRTVGISRPEQSPLDKVSAARLVSFMGAVALVGCIAQVPEGNSTTESASKEGKVEARRPRTEVHESLLQDLELERAAADGAGRAWISAGSLPAQSATPGRWEIVFEAGPLGIAAGGMVYLQVSPFWGWSTPQVRDPSAPGFTEVETEAAGVVLEPRTLDQQLLGIGIGLGGHRLEHGDRIKIVYGAGPSGAIADRFAESESRFWIAVDGDGDGIRGLIDESPAVRVNAGPAARLLLFIPSTGEPGELLVGRIAIVDALGNRGTSFTGRVTLLADRQLVDLPDSVELGGNDGGVTSFVMSARSAGIIRVSAGTEEGLEATSNPLQIGNGIQRIRWADLQTHSGISDGTGRPEELLAYGRDVAGLDAVALTDHDHWGLRFLDQNQDEWAAIRSAVRQHHRPGEFVALAGFEWTSWIWGHRHVVFFAPDAELLSVMNPKTDTPQELWQELRGSSALTFAHHSAGGPISTDWGIPPDPELEPATEIVSVHGSSEAPDSPGVIYQPVAGNYVRDALDRGYQLGFIGSTDGHDGHPGLAHLAGPSGGLAAILTDELTAEGLRGSLENRWCYATNGPRIVLRVMLGEYRMGSRIPKSAMEAGPNSSDVRGIPANMLFVRALGSSPFDRLEVIGRGGVLTALVCRGELDCSLSAELSKVEVGDYYYVRAIQKNGGAAWSSPFFIVAD